MQIIIVLLVLCTSTLPSFAQFSIAQTVKATGLLKTASDGVKSVNSRVLSFLQNKYEKMDASVEKQSRKMLARMQQKEEKLKKHCTGKTVLKPHSYLRERMNDIIT